MPGSMDTWEFKVTTFNSLAGLFDARDRTRTCELLRGWVMSPDALPLAYLAIKLVEDRLDDVAEDPKDAALSDPSQ